MFRDKELANFPRTALNGHGSQISFPNRVEIGWDEVWNFREQVASGLSRMDGSQE